MATFYVFSSRHTLGQRYSAFLTRDFPGVRYTPWDWPDLAASVVSLVEAHGDACVVFREDIDESLSVRDALSRHFGAEAGDKIVEIPCDSATASCGTLDQMQIAA